MGIQKIQHKSRPYCFHLKYSSSGETTGIIKANGDCEIYKAELVNVGSYLIQGSEPQFPIYLKNNEEKTVSIVRQAAGQNSEVKLYTRRALEETKVSNVPDYGTFDGRYLYLLFGIVNQVVKVDTDLLAASNYLGEGTWNINPVASIINLPVLPNNSVWRSITFVKVGGIGKMFLQGSTISGNLEVYAAYILSDDRISDMNLLFETPYTLIHSGNLRISSGCCVYDFVQEKVYIALKSIGNGSATLTYDLVNKTSKESGLSANSTLVVDGNNIRSAQLIPHLSRFSYLADIDLDTEQFFNYKLGQNGFFVSSYAASLGFTERNQGTIARKTYFDSNGVPRLSVLVPNGSSQASQPYGASESLTLDVLKSTFTIFRQSYSIINYEGGLSRVGDVVDFEPGATYLKSVMGSNRSKQYYAISSNGSSKRLFIFNPYQEPMQFGYLEFNNNADQMHSNQLII